MLDEDPEIAKLLAMTREIAKSRTGHALPPLKAIIRSLNKAMLLKQRIQDHEQRLARLELAKSMMRISEKTLYSNKRYSRVRGEVIEMTYPLATKSKAG